MTRAIDRLLRDILHDIAATGAPEPRVEPSDWQPDVTAESKMLWAADGSGTGVYVDAGQPDAEALAHLVDQVQEWVIEELGRTHKPTNWPRCPAHPGSHPLWAVVSPGGVAVWACPANPGTATTIGSLGEPS